MIKLIKIALEKNERKSLYYVIISKKFINIFKKPECRIIFRERKHHHRHKLKDKNNIVKKYPTFFPDEDITGRIEITRPSAYFDYTSITVELIGLIENFIDPKNSINFLLLSNDLSKNGNLSKELNIFNFDFKKVKLQYESYKGDLIELKYLIRVTINKTMRSFSYEEEFAVIKSYDKEILKKNDEPISMNVGINNLLSILFELNHINYSIHGTLKGSVTFGKVNLLITKMEIQLLKKETIYANSNNKKKIKTNIISSYELIDGGPYKNETIPFRLFLSTYNLTPSYIDIASYFSTRYFLNLVIKDQENNSYFKQKEIFLFRLFINPKNKINNLQNNIDHLKNFITEPIDFGDYFSSFNDNEEKEENNLEDKFKEPEPSDFYFRSNLKGFIETNDSSGKGEENDKNINNIRNRSNSVFNINRNKNIFEINDENNINSDNNFYDDNLVIENKKKCFTAKKSKKNKKQNKVINIKEKNKYKNNDILINGNYYNVDNYIIYENSYNNVFIDKLKTSRIKTNINENNNNIYYNMNINNDKKEEKLDDDIDDIYTNKNDDIDDFKLYFPNEPFSTSLIMNNFPSSYNNIGNGDNDFRKNLMGERIKKIK